MANYYRRHGLNKKIKMASLGLRIVKQELKLLEKIKLENCTNSWETFDRIHRLEEKAKLYRTRLHHFCQMKIILKRKEVNNEHKKNFS